MLFLKPFFIRIPNPLRRAAPYLLITALAFGLTSWHVVHYPKLGPIDEQAHVDYFLKVRHGHVPRLNELMGQEALAEEACRGFDSAYVPPPCLADDARYEPTSFQFGGASAAAGHPPIYYAYTAVIAAPIGMLPGIESPVTAGRIATAAWLAAGLGFLWSALLVLGASRMGAATVVTLIALTPQVLHSTATINPDSTAVFAGGLMLWAATHRRTATWLILISAFVLFLKATNVLAVLAAALYVLFDRFKESRRRAILTSVGMVLAAGASAVSWTAIMRIRALPVPDSAVPIPGVDAGIMRLALNFMPPTTSPTLAPFFVASETYLTFATVANYLLLAGVFGAALLLPLSRVESRIGWISIVGMVFGPTVIMIAIGAAANDFFSPPSRYGLALVPFIAVGLAAAANRVAHVAMGIFVSGFFIVTVCVVSQSPFT